MKSDWKAMAAIVEKDLTAVRRSKAVFIPMLAVPLLMLIILPAGLMSMTRAAPAANSPFVERLPGAIANTVMALPPDERLLVLVGKYLMVPLFIIVPLMVASVLAVDAFAGEKERRTLEGLIHLPISERDLFYSKVAGAFFPAVIISLIGFVLHATIVNLIAWPVLERILIPDVAWLFTLLWVSPAAAAIGMGIMVRISYRSKSTQEAHQLGGAIVLPLIFLSVAQSGLLLVAPLPVVFAVGAAGWTFAIILLEKGARRFTRDRLAAQI